MFKQSLVLFLCLFINLNSAQAAEWFNANDGVVSIQNRMEYTTHEVELSKLNGGKANDVFLRGDMEVQNFHKEVSKYEPSRKMDAQRAFNMAKAMGGDKEANQILREFLDPLGVKPHEVKVHIDLDKSTYGINHTYQFTVRVPDTQDEIILQIEVDQQNKSESEFRQQFLSELIEARKKASEAYMIHMIEKSFLDNPTNAPKKVSNVSEAFLLNRGVAAGQIKAFIFHQGINGLGAKNASALNAD